MAAMWERRGLTPLEFLMKSRFPYEKLRGSTAPGLDPTNRITFDDSYYQRAAEFRHALSSLSEQDCLTLAQEEERTVSGTFDRSETSNAAELNEAQEAAQFYNQREADADFDAWARTPFWSITEAVALSLGKAPEVVTWEAVQDIETTSEFAKKFKARHRIINRAALAKALSAAMSPRVFLAWAERTRLSIPQALVDAIREFSPGASASGMQSNQLDEACSKILAQKDAENTILLQRISELEKILNKQYEIAKTLTPPQKTAITKRENSLMKLAITMAVCGYYYNPNEDYNKAIPEIHLDADLLQLDIDVGTVRKYINLSRQLLPKNFDMSILNNRKTSPKN